MKLFLLLIGILSSSCALSKKNYSGYGKASISKENLKKYSPPDVESVTFEKIDPYLDLIAPSPGVLHPNGREMFFSWRVTGATNVFKVNKPLGFPIQMTGGRQRKNLQALSPNGEYIIISLDRDGEEKPGLYWQSSNGGKLNEIQHLDKVITEFEFISNDSRFIFFRSNDQKENRFDIYKYDMKTQKKELVFSQDGLWSIADHKKDGRLLLRKFITNIAREFYEFNPKTGSLAPVYGQGMQEEIGALFGIRDGEYIIRTNQFHDFSRLYLLKNGKLKEITKNSDHDIESFYMNRNKTKIVYQLIKNGYKSARVLDAKTFQPIAIPDLVGYEHVHPGSISIDGKTLVLSFEKFDEPLSSFVYNFDTKKMTKWVMAATPEVDIKRFVQSRLEYYSNNNVKIPYFIFESEACKKSQKPCPIIVDYHGGPEGISLPGWDPIAQIFLENGFTYVYPNVRGSDGYGKNWLASDNREKRLEVISDIQAASIELKKKYAKNGVAPKIGITGGSYGGYLTLMGMSYFAGSYDAGVAVVGMSDLVSFLKNTAPHRRPLREAEYGYLEKDLDTLKKLSPINYIDRVSGPLLIIQGANDPRVPAGEAIQIHEMLKKRGRVSELILFPDEGHGSAKRSNKVKEVGHTLDFFLKHLK